jgi:hypothetical protein
VDAIWLGVTDRNPQIMASQARQFGIETNQTCGWVPYPIPKEVFILQEMHLTQNQVRQLLPVLQHFAEHGELPSFEDAKLMSEAVDLLEEE